MILTEEEAKTKRCQESFGPMPGATVTTSQSINPYGHSFNLPTGFAAPLNCIGSACMAWRWGRERIAGYCGKAGKP